MGSRSGCRILGEAPRARLQTEKLGPHHVDSSLPAIVGEDPRRKVSSGRVS